MQRITWSLGFLVAVGVATAVAQPPAGRGGPPGGGGRPPMPLIEVLDTDRDRVISSDELKNATSSLLTLDKNNDGKLTENEYGPHAGGRGQGGPPGGNRAGGNSRRGQSGGQEGRGGPGGHGPGENGPPEPSADRMVEHAMEFDADHDGQLSKAELKKFAEDFAQQHGPGGRPGGDNGNGPGPNGDERGERPQRPEE